MAAAGKIGDWAFKAFSAGLVVTTIYMGANFAVNLRRGFAWHKAQTKAEKERILQQMEADAAAQKDEEGSSNQNAERS